MLSLITYHLVRLLDVVDTDWHRFFFFKQKTAYEMRISDWSSDVCSSDLLTCPSIIRRYSGGRLHRSPHQGGREREIKSFHRFLPRHRDLCTYHDEGEREA